MRRRLRRPVCFVFGHIMPRPATGMTEGGYTYIDLHHMICGWCGATAGNR